MYNLFPDDPVLTKLANKINELETIAKLTTNRFSFIALVEFFELITKDYNLTKTNDYYRAMLLALASKKLNPTQSIANSNNHSLVNTMWSKELRSDKDDFCAYIGAVALKKLKSEIGLLNSPDALKFIQDCYYNYAIFTTFQNENHGFSRKIDPVRQELFKLMEQHECVYNMQNKIAKPMQS